MDLIITLKSCALFVPKWEKLASFTDVWRRAAGPLLYLGFLLPRYLLGWNHHVWQL